eukprot:Awhi_evm1s9682
MNTYNKILSLAVVTTSVQAVSVGRRSTYCQLKPNIDFGFSPLCDAPQTEQDCRNTQYCQWTGETTRSTTCVLKPGLNELYGSFCNTANTLEECNNDYCVFIGDYYFESLFTCTPHTGQNGFNDICRLQSFSREGCLSYPQCSFNVNPNIYQNNNFLQIIANIDEVIEEVFSGNVQVNENADYANGYCQTHPELASEIGEFEELGFLNGICDEVRSDEALCRTLIIAGCEWVAPAPAGSCQPGPQNEIGEFCNFADVRSDEALCRTLIIAGCEWVAPASAGSCQPGPQNEIGEFCNFADGWEDLCEIVNIFDGPGSCSWVPNVVQQTCLVKPGYEEFSVYCDLNIDNEGGCRNLFAYCDWATVALERPLTTTVFNTVQVTNVQTNTLIETEVVTSTIDFTKPPVTETESATITETNTVTETPLPVTDSTTETSFESVTETPTPETQTVTETPPAETSTVTETVTETEAPVTQTTFETSTATET